MTHQPNKPDPVDIDVARTLAALNSAAPPEGMETRIAQRLAEERTPSAPFLHSRQDAHGRVPHSSFLRGALTGALVATAACALIFYTTRPHRSALPQVAANASRPPHSITATPVSMKPDASTPCDTRTPHPNSAWVGNAATTAGVPHSSRSHRDEWDEQGRVPHPSSAWVGSVATTARTPHLIPASFAPSKPAPPVPLTAQERALAELAGNPAALAALNPSTEKSDAQREADFQKFFAPSPELIAAEKAQDEALGLAKPANAQPAKDQN